tara:strand:+ start:10762 stop:12378 length:1617 start_codon:yes stop_codon:yes gene_type:complete
LGEQNNIEDKLRDKLNSREFIIKDSWQADMDAKLGAYNSQERTGIYFWLLLGLLGSVVLASTIIYLTDVNSEQLTEYSPRLKSDLTSLLNTERETGLNNFDHKTELKESNINGKNERLAGLEKSSDKHSLLQSNLTKDRIQSELVAESKTDRKTYEDQTNTSEIKEGLKRPKSEVSESNNELIKSQNDKNISEKSSPKSSNNGDEKTEEDSTEKGVKSPNTNSDALNKNISNDTKITAGSGSTNSDQIYSRSIGLIHEENKTFQLAFINKRYSLLKASRLNETARLSQKPLKFITVPIESKWNASMSGGVSISFLNEDSFLNSLSSFNGNLESQPLISNQLDFRIGKKISENIELSSGISSTTYGEEITYLDHFRVNSTSFYEYTENGMWEIDSITTDSVFVLTIDSMEVIMMDTVYTQLNSDVNGKRAYSYLEIPFGLTYSISISNKSSLLLSSELALGILTKNEGNYYNGSLMPAQTKALIINSCLGVGYKRTLRNRLDFRTMLRVRKPLGNLNSTDEIIRKYWSYSITAGIGYTF